MPLRWRSYTEDRSKNSSTGKNLNPDVTSAVETSDSPNLETSKGDPIVRKLGDGARSSFEDYRDQMKGINQRGNHMVWTTLYAREHTDEGVSVFRAPEEAYNRMWLHHNEYYSDDTGKREFNDKIAITQAIADELPISEYEKKRSVELVLELNMKHFNRIGGLEAGILGTIAFVRDAELSNRTSNKSSNEILDKRMINSDEYKQLCDRLNIEYHKSLKKAKKLL